MPRLREKIIFLIHLKLKKNMKKINEWFEQCKKRKKQNLIMIISNKQNLISLLHIVRDSESTSR